MVFGFGGGDAAVLRMSETTRSRVLFDAHRFVLSTFAGTAKPTLSLATGCNHHEQGASMEGASGIRDLLGAACGVRLRDVVCRSFRLWPERPVLVLVHAFCSSTSEAPLNPLI